MTLDTSPQNDNEEYSAAPFPLADDRTLEFWQENLPKLGLAFNLRTLYQKPDICPICQGKETYQPADGDEPVACFCQLQKRHQAYIPYWNALDRLPNRYREVTQENLQAVERHLSPIQRAQFAIAIKAANQFAENPEGNLILSGAVGTGRTMLAAYIARSLTPIPSVFLTLRQLIVKLAQPAGDDPPDARNLLFHVPVLIIDDFSTAFTELDEYATRQLYDLIYHRWSELLPTVVTTSRKLNTIDDDSSVLSYIQQDARVYTFDWEPFQRASVAKKPLVPARGSKSAPVTVHFCPLLTGSEETHTPNIYPSPDNHCERPTTPQPIVIQHQSHYCLSGDYEVCPVYSLPESETIEELPPDIQYRRQENTRSVVGQRARLLSTLGIVGIILGVVLGSFLLFNQGFIQMLLNDLPVDTQPETLEIPEFVLPATRTPTPPPTPTPVPPTRTPFEPVTATTQFTVEGELAFSSNLRSAPNVADSEVIANLPAGITVDILGRDFGGEWVRVETDDGRGGWLAVTQFVSDGIDFLSLPVYDATRSSSPQESQGQLTSAGEVQGAGTPAPPGVFTIYLTFTDISGCSAYTFYLEHTFYLQDSTLRVSREGTGADFTGSYNSSSGLFYITGSSDIAIETWTGRIERNNLQLTIDSELEVDYYGDYCDTLWSVTGSTGIIDQ